MDPGEITLRAGASALGLNLDDQAFARLVRYTELLIKWNKVYNLTAIRQPEEILTHHLLDCLAIVAPLGRLAGERDINLLDVGSGAGLPGVILAIARPDVRVTCIDAVQKKTLFLQHVAGALQLTNLHALHGRVEAVTAPYAIIISRAFSSLAEFIRSSESALAENGIWLAMKGKTPTAELAELGSGIEVFHVEQLQVPDLKAERCLVCMRRSKQRSGSAA